MLHVPRIIGWEQTDHGSGLVVERVLNHDGSPSYSLNHRMLCKKTTPQEAIRMIQSCFAVMLRHGIVVSDECPSNFLVQELEQQKRLVIIDGLGHRRINIKSYLRDHFRFYANQKTKETKNHLLYYTNCFSR